MSEKITQTAGRDELGGFAPDFARYNDDILFGEDWNSGGIDLKTRCIVTVVALIASGATDSSLTFHLRNAKAHGVTAEEAAAVITHTAFYAGWPRAWAAFRQAKEVWGDRPAPSAPQTKEEYSAGVFFPIGEPNDAYARYFTGQSYLAPLSGAPLAMSNVTFEPGCRNFWHIHRAETGGGQALICVGGRGWYAEKGSGPVGMTPGSVVIIPAGAEHWHGAAADSWFSHIAVEIPGAGCATEWLRPVEDGEYPG